MSLIRFRPRLLQREHLQLLVEVMDTVQDHIGDDAVRAAAERYFGRSFESGEVLGRYLQDRDAHSQFYPWLLWDAGEREHRLGTRLLVAGNPMGPAREELLDALLDTAPDVFQVVRSGEHNTLLERVADGRLIALQEPVLHAVVGVGELLVARVLDLGDCQLLDAVHACLPTSARRGMVRAARKAARQPKETRQRLLTEAGHRAMGRAWRHESRLSGPDGAPVMRVTTRLSSDDDGALQRALSSAADEGLLRPREADAWTIGSPDLGQVGATVRLRGDRLVVSTSSFGSADRIAEQLQRRVPALRREITVLRDLDGLLYEDGLVHDEVRRMAQDWLEEFLAAFEDTPQKSLGGITPREAMQTRGGRSKVRNMLRSVRRFGDAAGAETPAVERIWARLGGR